MGPLRYALNALYSHNVDQPGSIDLNFAGVPRFSLADENGRAVFVPQTAIVAGTGLIATGNARRSSSFGQVVDRVSDLSSYARQVTLTVSPDFGFSVTQFTVNYTLNRITDTRRGFDGVTFDAPAVRSTERSKL